MNRSFRRRENDEVVRRRRSLERSDDVLHAYVSAHNQGKDADDDQNDVLPQYVVETAEVAVGPQHANLDESRERNAQHGQTERAEKRDEQLQTRYGHGQKDCEHRVLQYVFTVVSTFFVFKFFKRILFDHSKSAAIFLFVFNDESMGFSSHSTSIIVSGLHIV